MAWQRALDKGVGKIAIIDAIVEDLPNENREVIMTICLTGQSSSPTQI
jgi:hypothetical protein